MELTEEAFGHRDCIGRPWVASTSKVLNARQRDLAFLEGIAN